MNTLNSLYASLDYDIIAIMLSEIGWYRYLRLRSAASSDQIQVKIGGILWRICDEGDSADQQVCKVGRADACGLQVVGEGFDQVRDLGLTR